jgi:hypothetical protein
MRSLTPGQSPHFSPFSVSPPPAPLGPLSLRSPTFRLVLALRATRHDASDNAFTSSLRGRQPRAVRFRHTREAAPDRDDRHHGRRPGRPPMRPDLHGHVVVASVCRVQPQFKRTQLMHSGPALAPSQRSGCEVSKPPSVQATAHNPHAHAHGVPPELELEEPLVTELDADVAVAMVAAPPDAVVDDDSTMTLRPHAPTMLTTKGRGTMKPRTSQCYRDHRST